MCDQQSLRSASASAQSDQNLCLSLEYSMTINLLTEHHLDFVSLKKAVQARLSLHLSKYHVCFWKSHVAGHIYDMGLIARKQSMFVTM